jgi:hypothetical protein
MDDAAAAAVLQTVSVPPGLPTLTEQSAGAAPSGSKRGREDAADDEAAGGAGEGATGRPVQRYRLQEGVLAASEGDAKSDVLMVVARDKIGLGITHPVVF